MKKADIKIGFLCNNRCLFCVQGNKRDKIGNKSFEEVMNQIDEAIKDCSDVVFTGGEPTVHKDFLKFVNYARKLGFKNIQIQTNGRLFAYRDFCLESIKNGASEFCIAIHGHNAKVHDNLTCSAGSFKQTVKGIENIRSLGKEVVTNTVITKTNFRYLSEIANLLVNLDVSQFQFAFPHAIGRAGENFRLIIPRIKDVIPYVKKGLDIGISAKRRVMTEAIPFCFMTEYEEQIAERIIPEAKVFDADFVVDGYSKYRKDKGKMKGTSCKKCNRYKICEGSWKEYPEKFGWKEFKPVDA